MLGASMFFGRLITLFHWGSIVDKYNKKKILYSTMFMMSLFTIVFGFVLNFPTLLILRFMTGVFNPLPVVIKP
jgi:MFS family permease